ncbi:active breakpoint cluster region-related protein isoform X2 [Phlebotomus papatasi]|uniref:active breakpoint cluster region-related protein isoform X2 n=1 Tax=Phlebotomus papatasi TaxID=29031 RepID=UPI00248339F9|nr:active breakpoint cluster region-related protein isoform X2 [Phlebotomus papatasi]
MDTLPVSTKSAILSPNNTLKDNKGYHLKKKVEKMLSVSDRIKLWSNKKTLISAAPSLDTSNTSNGSKSSSNGKSGEGDEGSNNTKRSLVQLRRDGPLNQCINELSSRKCFSEVPQEVRDGQESVASPTKSRRNSQSDAVPSTPSHFVTVIEVKETKPIDTAASVAPTATAEDDDEDIGEEMVITTRDSSAARNICDGGDDFGASRSSFLSDGRNVDAGEGTFLDKKVKPSLPPGLPQDVKKKVPPRPPPKFIRRAAPVDPPTVPGTAPVTARKSADSDSPSSSLERNIKPSDIQRQKSSDSLDVKLGERRTVNDVGKVPKGSDNQSADSRKIKSENLEKPRLASESIRSNNSSQSPTGSLGKAASQVTTTATTSGASPTGSLGKGPGNRSTESPTGSLEKMNNRTNEGLQSVGSKESLASQGAISERIKSYESISSLSSDSIKAGGQVLDNEPYYDTVPMDNGDGDYVYIQAGGGTTGSGGGAGGTGSTSSRDDISTAGSTLPMPAYPRSQNSSQASVHVEPESPGKSSNYVNINYFLMQNHETRSSSIDSDDEGDQPPLMRAISHDDNPNTPGAFRKLQSGASRNTTIRQIISSIITSETFYVECLGKMMQYMKAIRATLTTSQPVISDEEFQTMFFKIEELHGVHTNFLAELRAKAAQQDDDICIGDTFKKMAGHINLYGAFLHNYGRAIDTVKKCGQNNVQFKEIVSRIVLNSKNEQSLTLEDLLHKPVARVQKNALVLEDLLNQTPPTHADHPPLKQAQHLIRSLLAEFNNIQTKSLLSDDKTLRRLVKHSTIVELVDGHRKLRHLFLFNDVIACAKYKAQRQTHFEFEVKWYILLRDINVLRESPYDPKEVNPVNILQLKSQACTVRDQIQLEKHEEKMKGKGNASKVGDKHRKKLAELESQLVLASPNLVFRLSNKTTNKIMVFFLSSDFERTQWIGSILTLQESCNLPGVQPVNLYDLQMSIAACQAIVQSEMGSSYLMLKNNDESLLFGDLHLTIQGLTGLDHAADLFICVEIDSYSHYFRKAKTKLICRSSSPLWNESFVMELEGSQNVRFLLYEDHAHQAVLKAHQVLPLSRSWLQDVPTNKTLNLSESIKLNTTIKFLPDEGVLRRVPTSKPGALFGSKMLQVVKREKRNTPFIISACIREVERRGMSEVGIYRVSGSASDLTRLKKSFETNPYEAEQLLKEVDIHSVTGILKSYLRELPEALFTDQYYPKLSETYNKYSNFNEAERSKELLTIFNELPQPNKDTINFILDHLIRVHQQEAENKMSLHNLAMVFGPTLLRPGPVTGKQKDGLETSTVGVMAQAGILYSFLQARLK